MPWPTPLELHVLPFVLLFYAAAQVIRRRGTKERWFTKDYATAYILPVLAILFAVFFTGHGLLETSAGKITGIVVLAVQLFVLWDAYQSREWTARYLTHHAPF